MRHILRTRYVLAPTEICLCIIRSIIIFMGCPFADKSLSTGSMENERNVRMTLRCKPIYILTIDLVIVMSTCWDFQRSHVSRTSSFRLG